MTAPIRVLLADDQPLIRSGVAAVLGSAPDITVVGQAGDGSEAVRLAQLHRPDVVLMDLRMPVLDGIAATRAITAQPALAGVRILVLTTFDNDRNVLLALRAGASGFVGKGSEPADLIQAVRVVAAGDALLSPRATRALVEDYVLGGADPGPPYDEAADARAAFGQLTERELELVSWVALGSSNAEIAAALVLSPLTVKTHVNRAMAKVGARDRAQLVVLAYRTGLVHPRTRRPGPPGPA
ncbi:two component transcriptional regulator, LuxR family [Geodermatophilus telluris]|uniref:Two component transcriptional regulator, LuxR family n=1 Tax=Geodermatophilus telluris TaxID=1190417 RepID=A0A1G6TJU3_9ACTN|nr:response regulator transcription factor [Geodermatophilus telluris]SDD29321.1 two component transcriptional regulator, LuxR family [Geodermatophilus telluris]